MFTLKNITQDLTYSQDFTEFKRGIKISIPMLLGIIPFALVLGAQATQKGFSFIEVPLFTGLNFAGGSEFAILELWTNPPNILMLMFITFLVNSRHLLMGASLVPYLRHLPNKQVFPALFFMCDESWAVALADAQKDKLRPASIMPLICLFTQVSVLLFTSCGLDSPH